MDSKYTKVKKELNQVSPSFCLAKWLQVTLHLQNGQTHSCHHPMTHKVSLEELYNDPSALHNTKYKKKLRKQMLEGERPKECTYCWKIEDAHPDNFSDRVIKSSNDLDQLERIASMPWDQSLSPRYLEVSFGNECNFRCAYCSPHISSAIFQEYQKHGHYKTMPGFAFDVLKGEGLYPKNKTEENPYVDAFWKWWPDVVHDLKVFRITGGEPLINMNTFRFLDYIIDNPMPELEFAINSNLGIPDANFEKFITKINHIIENKLVKRFSLFTSVDTAGKNAEFVRFGLNYDQYMSRVQQFLERTPPSAELIFMSTYNAFSVLNFRKFLETVTELKSGYRTEQGYNRVRLDTPYLKDPQFLSCYVLTEEFLPVVRRDLEYIKANGLKDHGGISLYDEDEISKFERILKWMEGLEESTHRTNTRRALYVFIKEYEQKKGIKFSDYCPEYLTFYHFCRMTHLSSI